MRILEIIPTINGGGAEKLVYDLSKRFAKNNKVFIITFYNEPNTERYKQLKQCGVEIIALNKNKGLSISTLFNVYKIAKKIKPHIIHSHLSVNVYLFPYYLFHKKQKGFHTVHNLAEKEQFGIHKKITNWLYHHRKVKPIAISNMVEDSIIKGYKLEKGSFPNIYNGIDLKRFANDKIVDKVQNFIAIGRLTPQKNYPLMLNAFKAALEKYPELTLTILGDGELKEEICKLPYKLGIEKNVTFVGNVEDVENYISKADCLLMSSDYEGLPLSVVECMASGLPVVATKAGGLLELVEDNINGYLSDIGDIEELTKNIIKLIETDSNHLAAFSVKSKELSQKFNIENCVKNYLELFNCFAKAF